jgi:serine O-acetyltransferase
VKHKKEDTCKIDFQELSSIKARLPEIAEDIIESCSDQECYTHIDYEPIPSKESVIEILNRLREILFPGYFSRGKIDMLSEQICHSIRHDCLRYDQPCSECDEQGYQLALQFLEAIPALRKALAADVRATYHGDPAAKSYDEVIFSYPGILAISVYRIAHQLVNLGVPLLPRIMTEYAHCITGIDIHPAAKIGRSFVIDHGTGVVIGETTEIGGNVRIYQGVTLGALSIPKGASDEFRGQKRHPTIEDDVIIYSGATILGGETVYG